MLLPVPRSPEDIRRRLDELLERAKSFLPPRDEPESPWPRQPVRFSAPMSEMWRFLISSLQTVGSACGKDSPHLRELERCREGFVRDKHLDLDSCAGALAAARDDLDAGMLADLQQLVRAEAFGDLLESAVHLHEAEHYIPAVAVAGAVLESSLRTLALSKGVPWNGESSISKLNVALCGAKVYDKVLFGEIEAWGKLRNQVDHGHFKSVDEVDARRAGRMLEGIRDFVAKHR